MKTKTRIITQAIAAYNAHGINNISSRDLAKMLGMSHGNIEYHFPNKEALLKAIYKRMRKEISQAYEDKNEAADSFASFNRLLLAVDDFQEKYLFFNLDIVEISRTFPEVDSILKSTILIRGDQTTHFFRQFKSQGYFKDEMFPGMYMRLQHTIRILLTFWKPQQEVLPNISSIQKGEMATHIWELLVPNMTKKGLEAYRSINAEHVLL